MRRRRLTVAGLLLLALPLAFSGPAAAAPAPPCSTASYPVPWFKFYGGLVVKKTRYIELHIRPTLGNPERDWADVEYPFTLTITRGGTRNFTVKDYAKQQFPMKFTNTKQKGTVTATYTEIHTSYPLLPGVPVNTRCSRTITRTFKAPKPPKKTSSGGGTSGGGGQGEDTVDR